MPFKSSIAGDAAIQSAQWLYMKRQSIKSVIMWNNNPIPMILNGFLKKSKLM